MSDSTPLDAAPGTYVLRLYARRAESVRVGRLGTLAVQPGTYLYVGSALGPGGVRARVRRHLRADGALHWHIDYLRANTQLEGAWVTGDGLRRECRWARQLRQCPDASVPMAGFGASDCDCPAHLIRWAEPPTTERIQRVLQTEPQNETAAVRFVSSEALGG